MCRLTMATDTVEVALLSSAAAICESCGLCCSGALFLCVELPLDEVLGARHCGLDVRETPTITGFPLPCSQYRDRRCAVYEDAGRPHVCHSYRCWLLHRYLTGHVTLKHARRMIRLAKRNQARVACRIGSKTTGFIRNAKRVVTLTGGPFADVSATEWSRVESYLADVDGACDESGRVSAELIRHIFKAGGFLRRHFVWPEAATVQAQSTSMKPKPCVSTKTADDMMDKLVRFGGVLPPQHSS